MWRRPQDRDLSPASRSRGTAGQDAAQRAARSREACCQVLSGRGRGEGREEGLGPAALDTAPGGRCRAQRLVLSAVSMPRALGFAQWDVRGPEASGTV